MGSLLDFALRDGHALLGCEQHRFHRVCRNPVDLSLPYQRAPMGLGLSIDLFETHRPDG